MGFWTHVANVGVRDDTDDLVVIAARKPCAAAGMFTRSRFAGPSVQISREALAGGTLQAIVTVSKNANVANGKRGDDDARAVVAATAAVLGCDPGLVAIGSTGVIGRPYPLDRIVGHIANIDVPLEEADLLSAAGGIMTTDTHPKIATARAGAATVTGIAKGVGMIEPDMATMLTYILTDAQVNQADLKRIFAKVVERTYNCVSIDTDTSTSDSAIIMASGDAGPVDPQSLEAAIGDVAMSLTKQIARDGEGATKLLEVVVSRAADYGQAKRVAKSIVNSPLVKTAVHGADPNWGRVAMAIGKCSDDGDIDQDAVAISFGEIAVYPEPEGGAPLERLERYMAGEEVTIHVALNTGESSATVWGCDLSAEYVSINSEYTT